MISPVLKLPFTVDIKRLNEDLMERGVFRYMQPSGTVSLMHRPGAADPWADGTTTQVLTADQEFSFSERDFSVLNPGLEGSYFSSITGTLRAAARDRLGR